MPSAASISLLISGTFPKRVSGGHEQAPCHAAESRRHARSVGVCGGDRRKKSAESGKGLPPSGKNLPPLPPRRRRSTPERDPFSGDRYARARMLCAPRADEPR
nr:hypothetical protein [Gammaproteobacteria bacterium]